MALIKIKNLFLRAYIGFSEHEIDKLQDVVINVSIEYDSLLAEMSDAPEDALNYKLVNKQIVHLVENGKFNLLESLGRQILNLIMSHQLINEAIVEVEKPNALRFADSVSLTLSSKRDAE